MQVAEKLKDLNIQQLKPASLPTDQPHPVRRKRFKRNSALVNVVEGDNIWVAQMPEHSKYDLREEPGSSHEVEETPDFRARVQSLPSRSPAASKEPAKATEDLELLEQKPMGTPRTPSPPQTTTTDSNTLTAIAVDLMERSVSPLPRREDLTPDQAALTWQEDEITGYDVDPESGDDGEGINGIGFKPTPTIAYARRQKRKQQVNEWKAREAREARQKRFERRRGGTVGAPTVCQDTNDGDARRIVRFVGVG